MLRTVLFYALEGLPVGGPRPTGHPQLVPGVPGQRVLASINHVLYRLSEPVLGPVRRLLPPARVGGIGIDLSFIIVFFGIQLIVIPIVLRS